MPIVVLHVRPDWLPSPEISVESIDLLSPQHKLTYNFKRMLVGSVTRVLNQVDGSSFTPDQVVLKIMPLHPWSENVSDYMIDVQPSEIDGWFDWFGRRAHRRRRIDELLREYISEFVAHQGRWGEYDVEVTYDIDVRPISDSGSSTGLQGNVIRW